MSSRSTSTSTSALNANQTNEGDFDDLSIGHVFGTDMFSWLRDLEHGSDTITGIATGLTDFDNLTGGLHKGELIVLAGHPSVGRTSLALTIAQSAVLSQQPVSVLLFSLEMPKKQIALRLLSSLAEFNHGKLRIGRIGRNGIWAFILRNTQLPGLLAGRFNGQICNPPRLAMAVLVIAPTGKS